MVPPLQEPPDGEWHCPRCPPIEEVQMLDVEDVENGVQHKVVNLAGETSTFSDPQTPVEVTSVRKGRKKGRPRKSKVATISNGSDIDEDVEVDDSLITPSKARGRPRKCAIWSRPSPASSDEEVDTFSVRPGKRKRPLQQRTPALTNLPRVRLRLPGQRGKGKEREEEEAPRGLFDDILSPEERDTTKSTVTNADKLYFERSRIAAEVGLYVTSLHCD